MGCGASSVPPSALPESLFDSKYDLYLLERKGGKDRVDFESRYRGKVLLIMNFNPRDARFASNDINGLVEVQKMLEKSKKHRGRLHLLLFPSDDFRDPLMEDEWHTLFQKKKNWVPGVDPDVAKQCHWLSTLPNCDVFRPVPCTGGKINDLWKFLSQKMPGKPSYLPYYKNAASIKWDFTKFLVDASGKLAYRFDPWMSVMEIYDCGCLFPLLGEVEAPASPGKAAKSEKMKSVKDEKGMETRRVVELFAEAAAKKDVSDLRKVVSENQNEGEGIGEERELAGEKINSSKASPTGVVPKPKRSPKTFAVTAAQKGKCAKARLVTVAAKVVKVAAHKAADRHVKFGKGTRENSLDSRETSENALETGKAAAAMKSPGKAKEAKANTVWKAKTLMVGKTLALRPMKARTNPLSAKRKAGSPPQKDFSKSLGQESFESPYRVDVVRPAST